MGNEASGYHFHSNDVITDLPNYLFTSLRPKGGTMARIAGVDLPREKRVDIGLTYIYGIGRHAAQDIIRKAGVEGSVRVKDLKEDDIVKLREVIEKECKVEGDLRKEISMNIKRLIDTGVYRGLRHRRGLPVRGQRTKTNARTRKGRRTSIGKARKTETAPKGK